MQRRRRLFREHMAQPWRFFAWLAVAALLLRAMVPAGFMPDAEAARSGRIVLALCIGGAQGVAFELTKPAEGAPAAPDAAPGVECPFGIVAHQDMMPGTVVAPWHVAAAQRPLLGPGYVVARIAFFAGPALGARAPPANLV